MLKGAYWASPHPKADKATAPELAVDGHGKQGKVALVPGHLEAVANGPHVSGKERPLLPYKAALVPREP